jgi:hypothetical protein
MQFQFSEQSGLHGRQILRRIDRFAFVPKSEKGQKEYIFAYRDRVPAPTEEPYLYAGAKIESVSPDEVTLSFDGLTEVVMLLTISADDKFRKENPEMVAANEMFRIDG